MERHPCAKCGETITGKAMKVRYLKGQCQKIFLLLVYTSDSFANFEFFFFEIGSFSLLPLSMTSATKGLGKVGWFNDFNSSGDGKLFTCHTTCNSFHKTEKKLILEKALPYRHFFYRLSL
jgi:hypothetical protein